MNEKVLYKFEMFDAEKRSLMGCFKMILEMSLFKSMDHLSKPYLGQIFLTEKNKTFFLPI
jgi:hypothetical protein